MDEMQLKPGTVLAEKYRLGSVIGVGGMGTVYVAEHLALKATVAIKVIDRKVDEGDVALARFMREAQAAASLRSPHVVQILDYGMEGKRPFMVMEMLEGEPLSDRIKRVGRLTPRETLRVISHVAKAVSKAHEANIIHRDLKPDNIFLVHNEGDEIAKVLDFGVAKVDITALDKEGHTRTGSLLGTPYYMSPEQTQGNKDIDSRSDLWALGVIAFECLTGARPFSSDGLGDLVLQICIRDIPRPSDIATLPPGFDAWFFKACERELSQRFQTARSLTEALRGALGLEDESAPEAKWSAAPTPPLPTSLQVFEDNTTHPDSEPEPGDSLSSMAPDDPLLSSDSVSELSEADEDKSDVENMTRAGSQWEVVPHEGADSSSSKPPSLELPSSARQGSTASAVGKVALFALLIGAAIVFGVKQVDIDSASPPRTTKSTQAKSAKTTKKNVPAPAVKKKKKKKSSAQEEKLGSKASSDKGKQASNPEEQEKNRDEKQDATAEDALSAIELEAQEALAEREASKNKANNKEVGDDSSGSPKKPSPETQEGDPSQPQPKLPDGLTTAPAPPPPPG